jgi:hypothetical protein
MANVTQGPLEGYRPEMDGPSHEATYKAFTHFASVAMLFVMCCITGLAVGGTRHAWLSAVFGIILAHIATAIGLFSTKVSWRAPAAVLVLLLVMLLLY